MSANINSMAYTGATPWHGQGEKVDHAMTSAEAITSAKLDWTVEKKEIFFHSDFTGVGSPIFRKVPDQFATVRADTKEALGVVGSKYQVLQNKDAFKFFDAIVGERLAAFHTAGALGLGERIWMLAKLPGECWITPQDKIEKYLLLTNSHNGWSSVQIMATPIRVVCQNTLNMAIDNAATRSRVRHTLSMGHSIKEIRDQLGIADQYFRIFETMSKALVSKQANGAVVEQLFTDLGLSKEKAKESTRTENVRFDILKMFEKGKGNDMTSVKGSAWALLNGVVEYVDYTRSARGETAAEKMDSRTNSLLFGGGATMKQKALDSLIAMTK
jgi:phage/plasmid-like protein (TIGR03299 family)